MDIIQNGAFQTISLVSMDVMQNGIFKTISMVTIQISIAETSKDNLY